MNDNPENARPRVSMGVWITKGDTVLLGKRKGATGDGEWGLPGGHLEHLETFEEGVVREVEEETGIQIKNIEFALVANIRKFVPKHYVYIGFIAEWLSGEPAVKEKDKCEEWIWAPVSNLPEGIKTIPELYVEAHATGCCFFPDVS